MQNNPNNKFVDLEQVFYKSNYAEWWTCICITKELEIEIHINSRGVLWKIIEIGQ
jgi:hypothetical protein